MSVQSKQYSLQCSCGSVQIQVDGMPKVKGHCHCDDCRDLLNTPYHSVDAWEKTQLNIVDGSDLLCEFQHPTLKMKRFFCIKCGDTVFNTNAMDWRVVSQHLICKSLGELPAELSSESHFFYSQRIIDVDDNLPKYD